MRNQGYRIEGQGDGDFIVESVHELPELADPAMLPSEVPIPEIGEGRDHKEDESEESSTTRGSEDQEEDRWGQDHPTHCYQIGQSATISAPHAPHHHRLVWMRSLLDR